MAPYLPLDLDFAQARVLRAKTSGIVVHHTAGSHKQSVLGVHRYHRYERGYFGVGYNLLQTAEGVWYEGRGLDYEGAHATSYNRSHLGVCLIGNFEDYRLPVHRYESLADLLVWACRHYGLDAVDVRGHRELAGAATACPGRHLDLSQLRADVARRLADPEPVTQEVYRALVDGVQVGAFADPDNASRVLREGMREGAAEVAFHRVG